MQDLIRFGICESVLSQGVVLIMRRIGRRPIPISDEKKRAIIAEYYREDEQRPTVREILEKYNISEYRFRKVLKENDMGA